MPDENTVVFVGRCLVLGVWLWMLCWLVLCFGYGHLIKWVQIMLSDKK